MPGEKKELIFAWNYLTWGGAQIYFLGIMKLAKPDWNVVVILPKNSDPKLLGFIEQIGVKCEFLERFADMTAQTTILGKIGRRISIFLSEVEVFRHLLKFDLCRCVLHIEAAPWQSLTLLAALSARGANIFVTFHNSLPEAPKWREIIWELKMGIATRLSGFHVFTSNVDTKNRFRRWVGDGFWHKIKVTYTTVNPPEIDAVLSSSIDTTLIRARCGLSENRFVVMALGQFIDRKGRWIFLEAAKTICSKRDDIQFVWVTASEVPVEDTIRIETFELGDRFVLLNSDIVGTEREQILGIYRGADIFALPSYVEGLPVALLEAMAMGVPSISTSVNAIPEAIIDGETGLLIEPGNSEQLANAIIRLKTDNQLRSRIAKAGRELVMASFDERVASKIAIDAYVEALEA